MRGLFFLSTGWDNGRSGVAQTAPQTSARTPERADAGENEILQLAAIPINTGPAATNADASSVAAAAAEEEDTAGPTRVEGC